MHVLIKYVDDAELYKASPRGWRLMRGDGIDYVDLCISEGLAYRIQGWSVYWLYQEGDAWVLGGGTVGRVEGIQEVVATDTFVTRGPKYMPDLKHDQVKLGWWE